MPTIPWQNSLPPWDAQDAGNCTEPKALHPPLLPEPFGSRPSGASGMPCQGHAMNAMNAMAVHYRFTDQFTTSH